jgi:lipoic acid synthetase
LTPETAVEALTPDFSGSKQAVERVATSGLDVFAQNIETVERLTGHVRDPRAGYSQTLDVLDRAKQCAPGILTKTSLMLGLGETTDEILATMDDLRARDVDILTLGQYLQPTTYHLPVERFVPPDEFASLRAEGLQRGFIEVVAGPLVRSSYRAPDSALGRRSSMPSRPTSASKAMTRSRRSLGSTP